MALSEAAIGLDACYPANPPQVAAIRRAVSDFALRSGAGSTALIRIELAVSEAATNVVLHAYRPTGRAGDIHVTAALVDGAFEVRVRDDGGGMAPRTDSPGMGLGLSLMAGESDCFAIRDADGGGTEVILRFELAASKRLAEPGAPC
jgi:serine/threonine-protein kinase RsbW